MSSRPSADFWAKFQAHQYSGDAAAAVSGSNTPLSYQALQTAIVNAGNSDPITGKPYALAPVLSTPTISDRVTTTNPPVSTPSTTPVRNSNLKYYIIAGLAAIVLGIGYGVKSKRK